MVRNETVIITITAILDVQYDDDEEDLTEAVGDIVSEGSFMADAEMHHEILD